MKALYPTLMAAAAALLGVAAADAQPVGEPLRLEKVEVVGSHLKKPEQSEVVPVTTYRREDIEASGAARVGEFLLGTPLAGAASFDDRANLFSFHTGTAALSLRGMGPGATLVLLNGRRIAAYGLALDGGETFVDLNSLPLSAVERIEVLRDGASAIYGADAIGGVVNIVLRRNFRGAETSFQYGGSTHGDANRRYASVTLGGGDFVKDGYNAFLTVDALKDDGLLAIARAFSASADHRPRGGTDNRSVLSFPPTVQPIGAAPMAAPGCPADRVVSGLGTDTYCLFDPNPYASLLPATRRVGSLAVGSLALPGQSRLYGELSLGQTRTEHHIAPSPQFTLLPASAPTNPYGVDTIVYWRLMDAGPRRTETTIDFTRVVLGLEGKQEDWEWDVAAGTSRVATHFRSLNQPNGDLAQTAVENGTLNPFVVGNDASVIAAVTADAGNRFAGTSRFVAAKATSELAQLAQGPLALAIGAEQRREGFSTALDPLVLSGIVQGPAFENEQAERSISAAFIELAWPAVEGIELQLAARHDRYNDYGSSTSPKLAIRWQPVRTFMLRASAGQGFLPPTLQALHAPSMSGIGGVVDPVRCPVTQSLEDCGSGAAALTWSGNPNLREERSRQYNLGIAFEPLPGVSIGLDTWRIKHSGKVQPGSAYILQNEAAFPGLVVRAAPSADDVAMGLPGPIVAFHDMYINVAEREVRGVDLELSAKALIPGAGVATVDGLLTYTDRFLEQVTPQSASVQRSGYNSHPRLRGQLGISLQRGDLQVGVSARYIGGYRNVRFEDESLRKVASWTGIDFNVSWSGKRDKVLVGMRNAFDRQPPVVDTGYDPTVHDPIGRLVSLSWRHSF